MAFLFRTGLKSCGRLAELSLRPLSATVSILPSSGVLQVPCGSSNFHTCPVLSAKKNMLGVREPEKWLSYNDIVYPPRDEGEPRRPAEIFHQRIHIKYSYKKLWYIAMMIRGMSVDEALKQLSFVSRNGGKIIKEAIEEAQELAVNEHNVEFKSNLWVAESYVGKAKIIKGMRKHSGLRFGVVHHRYTHYFLCLREGPPPKHYYAPPATGNQQMEEYLQDMRSRKIHLE